MAGRPADQLQNWPGRPAARRPLHALYRNNRDGTFTDITARSGLGVSMYGLGAAAADYDNDGRQDVYITGLDGNRLFRGIGGGRFEDVTGRAGVGASGFSTCAVWFDYDNDGRLDLFVCRYVEWSIETDLFCTLDGKTQIVLHAGILQRTEPVLFRNTGNGTFEDVTKAAGLYDPASKALGATLIDHDEDGRLDLFVANDTQPNRLYRNRGNGTFTDVAVTAGVAFNEAGVARAGMGTDAADYDGSGRASLVIGNFSNEMMALYTNEGNGLFIDEAPTSTIGRNSLLTLTFACFFFDYDLDGLLDIFAANGHVADDIQRVQPRVSYAQPPHLFRNLGGRRFEEVTARSGAALRPADGRARRRVWRLRWGWRSRSPHYDQQRTGDAVEKRRRDRASRAAHRAARHGVESRRHRRACRRTDGRWQPPLADGQDRIQLSVSKRAADHLRARARAGVQAIEIAWPSGRVDRLAGEKAGQFLIDRRRTRTSPRGRTLK